MKMILLKILALVLVAFTFSVCGVSCDSSETKEAFGGKIKDALQKKYPEVKGKLANMQITFDNISTISKDKKAKKNSCSADKIHLKLDTGDILTYNNDDSRFKFEVREKEKGVSVITSISSKIDDIDDDLRAYYSGKGLMIGGVKKGDCNGAYKDKNKNGFNVSGNCVNGLRDGIWTWTKEVEQRNTMGAALGMFLGVGAPKDTITQTITYKNGLMNGIRKVAQNDELFLVAIYKDDKNNDIAFSFDTHFSKKDCEEENWDIFEKGDKNVLYDTDKCPADFGKFNYVEFENGAFVLGRMYKGDFSNIKDEKELFAKLNSLTPESEVIVKQRTQPNAEILPQNNISNEHSENDLQSPNTAEQNQATINANLQGEAQIHLAPNNEFVALRKSPSGEVITPIYKKDFDSIVLQRLGNDDSGWAQVLYFPPNVSDKQNAIVGYIRTSQIDNSR
ncbi:hypothetical protein ACWIUD_05730 [Helicobacter sp. 23-1044]